MTKARDPGPHDLISDEILFERYCAGDTKAFEILLKRFQGLVYSLILRTLKNDSLADEIFQDVFYKVCKNKDQFRESISFKSWLVTICKNTCIDVARKRLRTPLINSFDAVEDEDGSRALSERIADEKATAPEEAVQWKIEDREMSALLDELPSEQRETFYLKVVMEMTFEEIGESMKVSVNTAKSRFRYALGALQGQVRRQQVVGKRPTQWRTL